MSKLFGQKIIVGRHVLHGYFDVKIEMSGDLKAFQYFFKFGYGFLEEVERL
ncbi:hypothetical protein D3C86_1858320 [compost metagenome]